jgi:hypothetical protein
MSGADAPAPALADAAAAGHRMAPRRTHAASGSGSSWRARPRHRAAASAPRAALLLLLASLCCCCCVAAAQLQSPAPSGCGGRPRCVVLASDGSAASIPPLFLRAITNDSVSEIVVPRGRYTLQPSAWAHLNQQRPYVVERNVTIRGASEAVRAFVGVVAAALRAIDRRVHTHAGCSAGVVWARARWCMHADGRGARRAPVSQYTLRAARPRIACAAPHFPHAQHTQPMHMHAHTHTHAHAHARTHTHTHTPPPMHARSRATHAVLVGPGLLAHREEAAHRVGRYSAL